MQEMEDSPTSAAVRRVNVVVALTLLLFVGLYCYTIFYTIVPWMGTSLLAVAHCVVLSYTSFSALCLFVLVPQDWSPDAEIHDSIVQVKRKTGQRRFCQKCQSFKPPRCHHCKICQRCILRMDHHCPWMNNCIGHRNYRAFVSFLIFMLMALSHDLILLFAQRRRLLAYPLQPPLLDIPPSPHTSLQSPWPSTLQVLVLFLCSSLWCVLLGLLIWHITLIASNKTTIEYYEGVHARLVATQSGRFWRHPYDLGLSTNFETLFGRAKWKWLLPFAHLEGDGISHRTIVDQHHE